MRLKPLYTAVFVATFAYAANAYSVTINAPTVDSGSEVPTESGANSSDSESPWTRRFDDVTGLFGVKVDGRATNEAGMNEGGSFNTFQPWTDDQFEAVGAYANTQVGFGCEGMNLGGIIDGQMGQYAGMIEEFISQAPALAVMYLAYSQPVVKAVIDEMNIVGQFGLDMSNMTCSGVRNLADKSHEEKKQAIAEADCTANAGFKDPACSTGDGIQASLMSTMRAAKQTVSSRTSSLMGKVSGATGGFIKSKGSANGGTSGGSTSGGASNGGASDPSGNLVGKNCSDIDVDAGTTPMILGASELDCKDIKKYSRLIPSYVIEEGAEAVTPRQVSVEDMSKEITNEHMDLLKNIYESDWKTFTASESYKDLVNRADIVVSKQELLFMQELARKNPAAAVRAQRQMATLSMMKELEIIISKIEIGVESGISNQIDGEHLSDRAIDQYGASLRVLRLEYDLLQAKIKADQQRTATLNGLARAMGE